MQNLKNFNLRWSVDDKLTDAAASMAATRDVIIPIDRSWIVWA